MRQCGTSSNIRETLTLIAGLIFLLPAALTAADKTLTLSQAPGAGQAAAPSDALNIEDAVQIALKNHPRIRSAAERIGAQKAVVGQEMSAYYPSITLNNFYQSSLAAGANKAADALATTGNFDITLYNFGKREAAVQSARETLESTRYVHRTVINDLIFGVKEAYYVYLAARALVRVREETVKDRELLVRQARGFFEVGTRPKIDVARAESNLFSAQADLIAAQNDVKIAWATLKNNLGVRDFPERPLVEDLSMGPVAMTMEQAKKDAHEIRPELLDFGAQRRARDQDIAEARRGHLPDILFHGDYGRRNNAGPGNFPLQPGWAARISLNIPIFSGFNQTYRVEETLRNYHILRAQEEEQRQLIDLEVEQSYLRVGESLERVKATEAAERAAKENLDLAQGRYQVGVGSIIEITDAQTLYTDAQTNQIRSIYDYKIAQAQLGRAIGRP